MNLKLPKLKLWALSLVIAFGLAISAAGVSITPTLAAAGTATGAVCNGSITVQFSGTSVLVTNNTPINQAVGEAAYYVFDNVLFHEQTFDRTGQFIPACSSKTLKVVAPTCAYELYAYTGQDTATFQYGETYGPNLLDYVRRTDLPYCINPRPYPNPTPTATPPVVRPRITIVPPPKVPLPGF